MGRIPTYEDQQTTVRPLATPYSQVDVGAPGRALEGLGEAGRGASRVMHDFYLQERRRAEQNALIEAETDLRQSRLRVMQGDGTSENPGLLSLRGEDARDVTRLALERYDEHVARISGGLADEKLRERFRLRSDALRVDHELDAQRYQRVEGDRHADEKFKALVSTAGNDAIEAAIDPNQMGRKMADAEVVFRGYLAERGRSDDEISAAIKEWRSKVVRGAIDSLLTQQRVTMARTMFDDNQGEMMVADRDVVTAELSKIEDATWAQGEAFALKDELELQGRADADTLDRAGTILRERYGQDARKYAAVSSAWEQIVAREDVEGNRRNEELTHDALDFIRQNGSLVGFSVALLRELPPSVRSSLETRASLASVGEEPDPRASKLYLLENWTMKSADEKREMIPEIAQQFGAYLTAGDLGTILQEVEGLQSTDVPALENDRAAFKGRIEAWNDDKGVRRKLDARQQALMLRMYEDGRAAVLKRSGAKGLTQEEQNQLLDQLFIGVWEGGFFRDNPEGGGSLLVFPHEKLIPHVFNRHLPIPRSEMGISEAAFGSLRNALKSNTALEPTDADVSKAWLKAIRGDPEASHLLDVINLAEAGEIIPEGANTDDWLGQWRRRKRETSNEQAGLLWLNNEALQIGVSIPPEMYAAGEHSLENRGKKPTAEAVMGEHILTLAEDLADELGETIVPPGGTDTETHRVYYALLQMGFTDDTARWAAGMPSYLQGETDRERLVSMRERGAATAAERRARFMNSARFRQHSGGLGLGPEPDRSRAPGSR